MAIGLFAIGAVIGFVVAAALAYAVGLPLGRLVARHGYFQPAILVLLGALLGTLTSVLFSALGNTYIFMAGMGFWQSVATNSLSGSLAGYLWWLLEERRRFTHSAKPNA